MLFAQIALCLLVPSDDWRYSSGIGYVRGEEPYQAKSPDEFYAYGVALARERRTDEAIGVFELIAQHGPDPRLRERSLFKRAEAYWSGARYGEAHRAYAFFVSRHPGSRHAGEAKERAMGCALRFAEVGDPNYLFGLIRVGSSWRTGVDLLRDFLRRYPREKFSARFYFLLGRFLVKIGIDPDAEIEFKFLVKEYPESPYAAQALVGIGEIQLRAFKGVTYDLRPLLEAKRHFRRFVEEYGALDRNLTAAVQGQITRIGELEAEKQYRNAEYYLRRGYPKSALLYFRYIVKSHAGTSWAGKAAKRCRDLEKANGSTDSP